MGVEENIDAVRRIEAAYHAADHDTVRSILREDFLPHTTGSESLPPGPDGAVLADQASHSSFPDRRTQILDAFGERDRVVTRIRFTGTNDGGLPQFGIPANGAKVDIEWIQVSRHDDEGRIAETWAQMEIPKLMQQLGAMPPMEGM